MPDLNVQTGFADINGTQIYYELAGEGQPFVMIHAGVADSRQWNNEFPYYAGRYKVLRYDMRDFGKSAPAEGEYNNVRNLNSLLDYLEIKDPIILMGCSIGGELTLNFTLAFPDRVKAMIVIGGYPNGAEINVPEPEEPFQRAQKAFEAGDYDLATEIETQIWFDGENRTPDQINPEMRKLAFDMNRIAIGNQAKKLGKHVKYDDTLVNDRMSELTLPSLIMVGANDLAAMVAATEYMGEHFPNATTVIIPNAAHLTNMDQPELFRQAVDQFLQDNNL